MKLATALVAALSLAAPGLRAGELKLADFQSSTHFVVKTTYEPFEEAIAKATDGKVTVRAYMGGELGAGPAQQYDRVVDGVADIALSLPGYTASLFPKTLLTELPGVIQPDTGTDRIIATQDRLSDEYRRVVLLALWNNAPNLLLMAQKPVKSIEDLKGLKIRVPSRNAGLVVQAWGGSPVSMAAPEIYSAMQTGVIDGAMIDPSALSAFKLKEVTGSITEGMQSTISSFFLIMNRDTFRGMTDAQQQALLSAGQQAARNGHDAWAAVSKTALADFAATDGKTLITLTPDAAKAFDDASAPVVEQALAEAESKGIDARAYVKALADD